MYLIFLILIIISILKNNSSSLLSRWKNRYEYLPQENNLEMLTDDLYDFEFTSIKPIMKSSSLDKLDRIEKNYNHISQSSILNISGPNQKQTHVFLPSINNIYDEIPLVPAGPFFLYRPTKRTSSASKPRSTWPTYFFRKMLPQKLETGKSVTSETKAISKSNERNFSFNGTTLTSASPPNNSTFLILSNITNTLTLFSLQNNTSTLTTLSALRNSTSTSSATATSLITTLKNKNVTISYCYKCGLNESGIPTAFCYNTFEGDDKRHSTRRRSLKIKCIRNKTESEEKRVAYGPFYRKGCFKRFLDVGIEYNERGCRTVIPTKGKSFASERLANMEYLLKHLDDGCVFSPYASITPFSPAISLFARYHVCVCSQKYCNRSNTINHNLKEYFIFIICTIVKYFLLNYIKQ